MYDRRGIEGSPESLHTGPAANKSAACRRFSASWKRTLEFVDRFEAQALRGVAVKRRAVATHDGRYRWSETGLRLGRDQGIFA